MKALVLGILAGFVFSVGLLHGAESVRFMGFEDVAPAPPAPPATFGNRTQTINIEIDGGNGIVGDVRADFFQVAGQLGRPLLKNIEIQAGVTLAEATRLRLSFQFPTVQRRTEILVRFKLEPANGQAAQALGDLRFEVFPESTTQELIALFQLKDKTARVEIFGSGRKLRDFLTKSHVPFEDGGDEVPDNFSSGRLYIGELSDAAQFQKIEDRSPNAQILVFAPDESMPPGVYLDRHGARALGHVTAPLLDRLAADPRAQLALIKIIHLLLTPTPSSS